MVERFIERGTTYPLKNGSLMLYETNCACEDVKFYFDQFIFTLMLTGHKTISSDHLKFEFFPGTFFIPEKGTVTNVTIPNASINNPTKCLVLEINPSLLKSYYEEILVSSAGTDILYQGPVETSENYFFSNDRLLIKAFKKLYEIQFQDRTPSKPLVEDLIIKEMLLRVFMTEGLYLLKGNFGKSIEDNHIRKVASFITNNLGQKITTEELAKIAGMGQTTFFNRFKAATGSSPIDYIVNERIQLAKILIKKGKLDLQEIAYKCGFNSYEYFCSRFKKIEKIKPTAFKKMQMGVITT